MEGKELLKLKNIIFSLITIPLKIPDFDSHFLKMIGPMLFKHSLPFVLFIAYAAGAQHIHRQALIPILYQTKQKALRVLDKITSR